MEPTTNNSKHLQTSSRSDIQIAQKVREVTDQEILMQLAYIMTLIGVAPEKMPGDTEKKIMISYIRINWSHEDMELMKRSFEWAIEKRPSDKRGNELITLYNRPFNIEYIKSITTAYKLHQAKQIRPQTNENEGMTNHKRAEGIIGMIAKQGPELYEKLKNIGKEKPKPQPQQNKATLEIKGIFKQYEDEFFKLREMSPSEFVTHNSKQMNFSEYCKARFKEDHPEIEEEQQETDTPNK